MDETTQHYLDSLLAIALPNGQAFVERQDLPLAKRLIDLGLAVNRIEYADCSGNRLDLVEQVGNEALSRDANCSRLNE